MTEPLSRRTLVRRAGATLGLALAAPALWLPRSARAAGVRQLESGKRGVTITLGLEHGPFPAPGAAYKDRTCLVFVPHHYRTPADGRIDTLVHFHGHHTTARKAVAGMKLREQLHQSQQNAVLIAPQGPVDAADSGGGKLEQEGGFEAMLGEVRRAIQGREVAEALGAAAIAGSARIGATAISAHSGGYRVAAACLERGGFDVNEVYLFDALYADRERYLAWILDRRQETAARRRHKLVTFYRSGKVRKQNVALMADLDAAAVSYVHVTREERLDDKRAIRGRAVFIKTQTPHNDVVHGRQALRRCLEWSCFRRRVS